MAENDADQQRTHQRVSAVKLVQYKHFDPDYAAERLIKDLGMGKTLDVSEGGLSFLCSQPLPASWGLHLDLVIGDEEILSVEGRIVHVEEICDGRYSIGVKFLHVTSDLRRRLRAIVWEKREAKLRSGSVSE